MNENRGMPERVKSIIRWTLLPTTSYKDIVDFFNDHKKLPINLIEALLKGVMENDEVLMMRCKDSSRRSIHCECR